MHLRTTSSASIRGEVTKGFPLILNDKYKVDWISLEYFLYLHRSVRVSSLGLYGRHLLDLLSQLKVDNIALDDINDDWLIAYKNSLLERKNVSGIRNSKNYASQVLRTVIHYLHWLEQNKFIRNVVGVTKNHRIRVEFGVVGKKGMKHPLTKNGSALNKRKITPRKEWIEAVKIHGPERRDLASRFELMIDWGSGAGLRAMEICALNKLCLPGRETAKKALEDGRKVYIQLPKTKGGKEDRILVSPLLVMRTWDYIDIYRPDVTEFFTNKFKAKYEVYEEPDEIFLSNKTGQAVNSRSFSNGVRSAFLKAVESGTLTLDEKVWAHGLRHNFTTNLLKGLDAGGVKRPEAIACQATRHSHEDSLEPYTSERFNEDFHG